MGAEERYVFPKKGMLVRDPRSKKPLPEKGTIVPWIGPVGRYWRRRFNEGSIGIKIQEEIIKKEEAAAEVIEEEAAVEEDDNLMFPKKVAGQRRNWKKEGNK